MCKIGMEITTQEDENMEEEDDNMVEAESMEEDELSMVERNMMLNQREDPDPDPYPFVDISPEQQLLLDNSPFVGDTRFPPYNNHFMPSPVDAAEIPPLPSSDDQHENLIVDAVEIDAGTQPGVVDLGEVRDTSDVVDLGKDSELGFSEAQLELNAKEMVEVPDRLNVLVRVSLEEENLEVGFDSSGN